MVLSISWTRRAWSWEKLKCEERIFVVQFLIWRYAHGGWEDFKPAEVFRFTVCYYH